MKGDIVYLADFREGQHALAMQHEKGSIRRYRKAGYRVVTESEFDKLWAEWFPHPRKQPAESEAARDA